MPVVRVDVCVIGAGPAGSALAARLARLGHSVAIVEACAFPRPRIGESLVASVWPLLDALRVRDAVERAGFVRSRGTLLRWTGSTEWRPGSAEPGLQVDRGRFDAILLDAARIAGAIVLQPARVISARRQKDEWSTIAQSAPRRVEISSRIVADAAGRHGRLGGRKCRSGPRTLALSAYWSGVVPKCQDPHVEAGENEWYWGTPLPDGRFVAAAFVDAADYRPGAVAFGNRSTYYEWLISRSQLLRRCLKGRRETNVHVHDASPCQDAEPATTDTIKVGEASFAIDPLSSQGVQTAIGSAVHAAAAVHTILERPDHAALAVEFYRTAQQRAVAFHARAAAAAYFEAAATRTTPFWRKRAAGHTGTSNDLPTVGQRRLSADAIVELSDRVRVDRAPVLKGDVIVPGTHVALQGSSASVAFLGGVELAPLLEIVREPMAVETIARAWSSHIPRERTAEILLWLWSHGALRQVGGSTEADVYSCDVADSST